MSSKKPKKQKKLNHVVKKPKSIPANAKVRRKPKYKSFRLHKRVKHHEPPIISSFKIVKQALRLLLENKKSLFFFSLIYGIAYLLFVRGIINPINISEIRNQIATTGVDSVNSLGANIFVLNELARSLSSGVTGSQGTYQVILLLIASLSLIWLFRQQQAGNKVTFKLALYRGMYPLIPFMLIFYLLIAELLPAVIGNYLYNTVISSGIATTSVEQYIWLILYLSSLLFSFYLISSSVFALLIVTLPEMTPMIALRKAKELVMFRRFSVFRKTIALGLFISASFFVLVLPVLFFSEIAAQILFFVLSIVLLPFSIAYLFVLYRELL